MSVQKYRISKHGSGFTTIPNKVIQGLAGEIELLGLYVFLSSLPEGWEFHKNYLREKCRIGVNKLSKLLTKLQNYGLCKIVQTRDEQGRFAHFDMQVFDGCDFNKNKELIESKEDIVQPLHGNRATVTVPRKTAPIKERIINETKSTKILSASDDAPDTSFDEFWKSYPIKKNKMRAKKIWHRKKYKENIGLILNDIQNRLKNDHQWQDNAYIPHASTYLNEERWNDSITPIKNKAKEIQTHQEARPKHNDFTGCSQNKERILQNRANSLRHIANIKESLGMYR